jgi:hypothetical protein
MASAVWYPGDVFIVHRDGERATIAKPREADPGFAEATAMKPADQRDQAIVLALAREQGVIPNWKKDVRPVPFCEE